MTIEESAKNITMRKKMMQAIEDADEKCAILLLISDNEALSASRCNASPPMVIGMMEIALQDALRGELPHGEQY